MKPIILVLLALGALVSCKDTPEVTDVGTDNGSPTPAEEGLGAMVGQGQGIAALKSAWDAAWAAKDAAAYAANYTVDADFVNPPGRVIAGREAIRAAHQFLFTGPFVGSTQTSEVRRTVFLTGESTMLDLDVALTGYAALPPGLLETSPGVVRTRVKWLVVKHQRNWKISAQQMTAVAPAP